MIEIDGFLWFVGALLICGVHALHLRGWRREQRQYQAWWKRYDAVAQQRHDAFMRVTDRDDARDLGWNLDGSRERGQA